MRFFFHLFTISCFFFLNCNRFFCVCVCVCVLSLLILEVQKLMLFFVLHLYYMYRCLVSLLTLLLFFFPDKRSQKRGSKEMHVVKDQLD